MRLTFSSLGGLLPTAIFAAVYACGGTNSPLNNDGGNGSDASQDVAPPQDGNVTPDSGLTCNAPMANCSGNPADGCNVNLSTDDANCGGCGVVCNTQCNQGVCPLFAPDAGTPQTVGDFACLTVDSTSVYWGTGLAANTGGGVWKVSINGGTPTQMIGLQDRPHAMASDGTNLYYANFGAVAGTGSIQRIPINGTVATPIALNQSSPLDVAVDGSNVYWTNSGDGSVWRSDKNTPNPQNVVPAAGQNHARFMAIDATNIYYTDQVANTVYRVAKTGGTPAAMTTVPTPSHIAVDTANAYVGSGQQGVAIISIALTANNGTSNQIMPNLKSLGGIQTDGTDVWFSEPTNVQPYTPNTGEIHRMTTAGQSDAKLATGQNGPGCIAVDGKSVYWINLGNATISKTGK